LRALVRTVLVVGLAVALLAVFLRNADLARVWDEMQAADAPLLAVSLALTAVAYLVRAERWQYLLGPIGRTRFWVAFRTTVIGFAVSFVVPARAGELVRPYLLARRERLPATAAFATIIVERLLDLAAVLVLLGLFFLVFAGDTAAVAPRLYRAVALGGLVMAPVGTGALIAMFLMAGHPERLHALVLSVERVLPRRLAHAVAGFARSFAEGLAVVRRPPRLVWAMVWSLVLWLAIAAQVWVVAKAFSIAVPVGGSLLVTAMLVVGVSIPTPGGVGGTHEAFRLGVTAFYGADNNAAVGAAILHHAVNFAPVTIAGLWFLGRDGLSIFRLREEAASAKVPAERAKGTGEAAASADGPVGRHRHEVTP
jgi:hypothetical protein